MPVVYKQTATNRHAGWINLSSVALRVFWSDIRVFVGRANISQQCSIERDTFYLFFRRPSSPHLSYSSFALAATISLFFKSLSPSRFSSSPCRIQGSEIHIFLLWSQTVPQRWDRGRTRAWELIHHRSQCRVPLCVYEWEESTQTPYETILKPCFNKLCLHLLDLLQWRLCHIENQY